MKREKKEHLAIIMQAIHGSQNVPFVRSDDCIEWNNFSTNLFDWSLIHLVRLHLFVLFGFCLFFFRFSSIFWACRKFKTREYIGNDIKLWTKAEYEFKAILYRQCEIDWAWRCSECSQDIANVANPTSARLNYKIWAEGSNSDGFIRKEL